LTATQSPPFQIRVLASNPAFAPTDVASLWTWAYAGDSAENLTIESVAPYSQPAIDTIVNLASPGTNDYFNNDSGDDRHGRPGHSFGFSSSSYSTALPCIAIEAWDGYSAPYAQYMYQAGHLNASGPFYLAAALVNSRTAGRRYLWGTDDVNWVKLIQERPDHHVRIRIAGGAEAELCADGALPEGASIVEVWRDNNDDLTCFINGVDETVGSPNRSGTFAMSGFGGGEQSGGSGWDDWLMEILACDDLPTLEERASLREFLNNRWWIY
jgi:hypothetical protein